MYNKALLFLFIFLIAACQNVEDTEQTETSVAKPANQAVVIINNSTESPVSLELLDTVAHRSDNWIVSYKAVDTLSLNLNQSARIIIHSLVAHPKTQFASPGDTVTINLNEYEMEIEATDRLGVEETVSNRDEFLLEVDSLYNLYIIADSSNSMRFTSDLSTVLLYPVSGNKSKVRSNPAQLEELVNRLIDQLEFVPSSLTEIENPELEVIQKLKSEIDRKEAHTRLFLLASQLDQPEIYSRVFNSDLYQTDTFVKSPFVRSYLGALIKWFVLKGEEDRTSNKSYVDYKKAYDRLPEYLEGEVLEFAREICLEQMVSYQESNLTVRKYLSEFLSDHQDTAFVRSFEDRFLLANVDSVELASDLSLMSNSGSMITLSEIVKNDLDSTYFYYVDFWASWCAPCREAMPASEEKRALFSEKGVKFIYLSMDRDKQKWKTASLSHHLETYEHSYLLTNPEEQQFIKDLKIDFIPRYVILNSEGKVIEGNAPGPEGERLTEVLDQYLNN